MSVVTCSRCHNKNPGVETIPFQGEIRDELKANICQECWQEWLGTQVMVINENNLILANPAHQEFLLKQMMGFFGLGGEKPPVLHNTPPE